MNVAIALESRFVQTPDGAVWSLGWLDTSFWGRYLEVFDRVRVIGRVGRANQPPAQGKRVDGERVEFAAIPYYVGPVQYALKSRAVRKAVRSALRPDEALILRVPGTIGSLAAGEAARRSMAFGVEVIGDPQEVFGAGGVKSILAPLMRVTAARALRNQCQRACAAAYVADHPLRARYPAGAHAFTTTYSSIDLRDEAFVPTPREYREPPSPLRMITVGSLAQLYKGTDILIRAMEKASGLSALVSPRVVPPHLTVLGDGKHRGELEQLARGCGVADRVHFAGQVPPGEGVRAALDASDLFVLPSRTEGLPRAMIEAMARGLPCLGTDVGGIPELIDASEQVAAGDENSLAEAIAAIAPDHGRLTDLSRRNLEKARRYHALELQPRRRAFYEAVRDGNR